MGLAFATIIIVDVVHFVPGYIVSNLKQFFNFVKCIFALHLDQLGFRSHCYFKSIAAHCQKCLLKKANCFVTQANGLFSSNTTNFQKSILYHVNCCCSFDLNLNLISLGCNLIGCYSDKKVAGWGCSFVDCRCLGGNTIRFECLWDLNYCYYYFWLLKVQVGKLAFTGLVVVWVVIFIEVLLDDGEVLFL